MLPRGKLREMDCITRDYPYPCANQKGFSAALLRAEIGRLQIDVATWQQASRAALRKGS